MTFSEMEAVIIDHGIMLQTVLLAAFTLEEHTTIGGNCCLSQGSGRGGDPAHMLDKALSVTKHIREGEHDRLRRWIKTDDIEPMRWPRAVIRFWVRVPQRAAWDMARAAQHVV